MLDILLSHGALGPKKIKEVLKSNDVNIGQANLDIVSLYKDRNLLDMLLREVSLCDSINNSLSGAFQESDAYSDDDSYLSLYELIEDKFDNFEGNEYQFPDMIEDYKTGYFRKVDKNINGDGNNGEKRRTKRPRRYFRNYDRKSALHKENIDANQKSAAEKNAAAMQSKAEDAVKFADHQNQVQLIQKNVRGWLLRRQYLDILHATRVLQTCKIFTINRSNKL